MADANVAQLGADCTWLESNINPVVGPVVYDTAAEPPDAATVEGWLGSELTDRITSVQANHNGWINSVLTPPAPATVDKALPW